MTEAARAHEDRKKTQCFLCDNKYRSDHLVRHMVNHKEHITLNINAHCRVAAIERQQPMLFYLPEFVTKRNGYTYDAKKRFCICLICEKGKYAGCRGKTPEEFYSEHRNSECMKQWETVANLFGTAPEVVPVEAPQPQMTPIIQRRIERFEEIIAHMEEEANKSTKRYNEMYSENAELRKENTQLRTQLLEIQATKTAPPAAYDFDVPTSGVTLPPAVNAVKSEVAEPSPTLTTVPDAEPAPADAEPEPAPPAPNANRPGYFLAKSGKWLKRATVTASAPAPEPASAYSQLPNPIVRNPGAYKLPGMTQIVAPKPAKPAPMPTLFNPSNFLASLMKEVDAPPSADEVAKDRASEVEELVEVTVFDLLENIVVHNWTPERVGAYIEKVQAENKDVKLFDIIMNKKCGAIIQYVDGDDSEDCMKSIEKLYEVWR